jgi:hypothetical protein
MVLFIIKSYSIGITPIECFQEAFDVCCLWFHGSRWKLGTSQFIISPSCVYNDTTVDARRLLRRGLLRIGHCLQLTILSPGTWWARIHWGVLRYLCKRLCASWLLREWLLWRRHNLRSIDCFLHSRIRGVRSSLPGCARLQMENAQNFHSFRVRQESDDIHSICYN